MSYMALDARCRYGAQWDCDMGREKIVWPYGSVVSYVRALVFKGWGHIKNVRIVLQNRINCLCNWYKNRQKTFFNKVEDKGWHSCTWVLLYTSWPQKCCLHRWQGTQEAFSIFIERKTMVKIEKKVIDKYCIRCYSNWAAAKQWQADQIAWVLVSDMKQ